MQLTVLLLIVIIAIALAKQMPVPKMRAPNMEKSALMQNKVLSIRGGGVVSKDFFVKFFAVRTKNYRLKGEWLDSWLRLAGKILEKFQKNFHKNLALLTALFTFYLSTAHPLDIFFRLK